jgi:hypothetical protein
MVSPKCSGHQRIVRITENGLCHVEDDSVCDGLSFQLGNKMYDYSTESGVTTYHQTPEP